MFNASEFTTHSWGEALRCCRTKPRKVPRCRTNERSDAKFFRNTDRHSLGTPLGSRCRSFTPVVDSSWADLRRNEHGDARRVVESAHGHSQGGCGRPAARGTLATEVEGAPRGRQQVTSVTKPASGSVVQLGAWVKSDDSRTTAAILPRPEVSLPRLLLLAAVGVPAAPADLRAKGVIASGVIAGRTSSRRYPSPQEFGARALGSRTSTGLPDHTAVHSEGRPDSLSSDLAVSPKSGRRAEECERAGQQGGALSATRYETSQLEARQLRPARPAFSGEGNQWLPDPLPLAFSG
ncbi:hypothetical protein HPB47_027783 [Ixodes persulcatus]|uniref:Uncharacterized protein n=1 Tax=Ixodes persulcatus TaxID=34615 RepID=A0AC60PV05_IXOPE|nr:hypothetical protein HPB47_027783 [Ixodes persulcatus]